MNRPHSSHFKTSDWNSILYISENSYVALRVRKPCSADETSFVFLQVLQFLPTKDEGLAGYIEKAIKSNEQKKNLLTDWFSHFMAYLSLLQNEHS